MSTLTYRGQIIEQRDSDGYVNMSQMAKANNCKLNDWTSSKKAKSYINTLAQESQKPANTLLLTVVEGFPAKQTTWGHPLVAIAFAQWISPSFHIWCNTHVKTLIDTGSTDLSRLQFDLPKTFGEALRILADKVDEVELLHSRIEADQPKVELAEAIATSDSCITISDFAKMIGWGRNRLYTKLRELNIIMPNSSLVYQRYLNAGYFEATEILTPHGVSPLSLITGKGQLWLCNRLQLESAPVSNGYDAIDLV